MKISKRLLAYLALFFTSAIWGVSVVVIKYTLNFIDPLSFLFWRFLISTVTLLPFFLVFLKKHPLSLSDSLNLFLLGVLATTIVLGLLFFGMQYTTAIDTSLISILGPIFIVFGGVYFLKEKVTKQEKFGLSIAVAGALLGVIEPLIKRNAFSQGLFGNSLVLLSYLVWAVYTLLYKKNSKKYHPLEITFFNFFSGFLTLAPVFLIKNFAIIHQSLLITLPRAAIAGILYMSLFSSCLAYFTYNLGVSLIESSEACLFEYLKPIFTIPLAFFWLKEEITLVYLAGAVMATIGVAIAQWR